ncbi:MAG: SIS domain-containing protein [Candidatus Sericytochromatia bacterium]|nr:SIS domain-containing protein [Candidatus Sericytochromatia bacterium]
MLKTAVSLEEVRRHDPADMFGCVAGWGQRARKAWEAARQLARADAPPRPARVVLVGMGGSAISADVAVEFLSSRWSIPMFVHRGAGLPAWVGHETTVVALSYSGETGETLAAVRQAVERGAPLVALTCGGRMATWVAEAGGTVFPLQPGWQPRAAMGEILFTLLALLSAWGAPIEADPALEAAEAFGEDLARGVREDHPALMLAERVAVAEPAWPIILGVSGTTAALAARWRGQFAENAKCLCASAVLPEATHNDLVPLALDRSRDSLLVALRDSGEDPWLARQADAALEIAGRPIVTFRSNLSDSLARLVEIILMGDLASVLLAWRRGVDPTPIEPLLALKARMRQP